MHEIVTLQFGQRANYLATHFWNIQESYFTYTPNASPSIVDHDINFRPGIGTDGSDTYTPRTVIYDLKGGFGTLKQQNALYDDTASAQRIAGPKVWNDSGLSTIKQLPIQPIPYQQNLEAGLPTSQLHKSQVRYWSDFNRVYFHPRSIVQLNEYSLNSSIAPFESWTAGEELFRDVDREADLLDRDVRPFAEECDSMQGFQIFAGVDDAWGGWTSRYIDLLRDEYGKKSTWVYGLEDNKQISRDKVLAKKANAAKTLSEVSKLGCGYTMLGTRPTHMPSYLQCDFSSEWESSAVLAAAVESATLPTRLRDNVGSMERSTMPQYEQFLSSDEGRNVWELGLTLDKDSEPNRTDGNANGNTSTNSTNLDPRVRQTSTNTNPNPQSTEDIPINIEPTTPDIPFTPSTSHLQPTTPSSRLRTRSHSTQLPSHTFTQILASRHHPHQFNYYPAPSHLTPETALRLRYADQPLIQTYSIPLAFPLLDAYPSALFTPPTHPTSTSQSSSISYANNSGVPLTAAFTTSTSMKRTIFELRDLVTRFSRVVAVDEREDLYNELTGVGERYAWGWEGDSDGEDGDDGDE